MEMTQCNSSSFFPEKYRILSGSSLKVLAMVIMLIDHTASFLLRYTSWANVSYGMIGHTPLSVYRVMRDIGRIAFPIFCFLLVEGFLHTRNRVKYGCNLFLFALISEIPWNFAQNGTLFFSAKQNVFFTLFLGYLAFCAMDYFKEKKLLQLLCVLGVFCLSYILHADYGWKGYVFLLIMFFLHDRSIGQAVIGSAWLVYEWKACFAFLFLNLYNGKRGFIQGKASKYLFYAFYPVHIGILVVLRYLIFGF